MKIFLFIIFLFTVGVVFAGDSGNDVKIWYQWHKDMFSEMAQDYNPNKAYQIPVLPNESNPSFKPNKKKKPVEKTEDAPVHYEPVTTAYHSDTAWGSLDATVIDNHDNYVIKVSSSKPAQKWILKSMDNKEVLKEGGLNEQQNFVINMNRSFQQHLALTVMIESEDQVYPALLPLTK